MLTGNGFLVVYFIDLVDVFVYKDK